MATRRVLLFGSLAALANLLVVLVYGDSGRAEDTTPSETVRFPLVKTRYVTMTFAHALNSTVFTLRIADDRVEIYFRNGTEMLVDESLPMSKALKDFWTVRPVETDPIQLRLILKRAGRLIAGMIADSPLPHKDGMLVFLREEDPPKNATALSGLGGLGRKGRF